MERRFVLFLVLSFAILFGHSYLTRSLDPQKPRPRADAPQDVEPEPEPGAKGDGGDVQPEKDPDGEQPKPAQPPEEEPAEPPKPPEQQGPVDRQWGTLGSGDPQQPYRMLVAWDNRGAAVARIELSSGRYHDLEDRGGYLGHLVMDPGAIGKNYDGKGCLVQMVGPGTPAAAAGLKPGDLIKRFSGGKIGAEIGGLEDLRETLKNSRQKRKVTLTVERDGEELKLEVTLGRRPLEVVRPEAEDPLSFLFTLQQVKGEDIEDAVLSRDDNAEESLEPGGELAGVDLWTGNWEVRQSDRDHVVFGRVLPKWGLEIVKSYRLAKVPEESIEKDVYYKAYHLVMEVQIRNVSAQEREVAYQLDGPTGLPAEGVWYTHKIGREWFQGVGQRDVVISKVIEGERTFDLIGCPTVAEDEFALANKDQLVSFIGVDATYFSAVLIPQTRGEDNRWGSAPMEVSQWQPLRVGEVDEGMKRMTNVSCRLVTQPYRLAPNGAVSHRFEIFAGPKKPELLARYDGLGELMYYGWFGFVARPMSVVLHFFYGIVHNYGLAILMLTVLVRGCMFPLSRKQALGARKMQELQPEIKRIQEKYKNDMEGRTKAQQELFRKHNYNPLSGCLVLFVQLPIFIGLYRSLMVDIELRDAPLLWGGVRWCSNLAAPDMLFDWSGFWTGIGWESFNNGQSMFALGPYFNVLPILTVVLFVVQQKMFMPPAMDEKSAQQQKMMKYMMIFMGVLFFKVASGLCIYFIASSMWGLAERKFLPKAAPAKPDVKPATRAEAKAREKPRPKPAPQQAASGRDGAAARRKKAKRGRK